MHNAIGPTLNFYDDTSYNIFQNLNVPANTIIFCGNIFLGIQGFMAIRFPLAEGADPRSLGRGGTVIANNIPPVITLKAAGTWTAGGTVSISMLLDDSPRLGPQDLQLAWKKPEGSGPSWRRDAWGVFDVRLEDTGGTPFIDNGVGTVQVGMAILTGLRLEIGARIIVPAGPSWSVARIINKMSRFGAPIGSTEVAIQSSVLNAVGYAEPDGVDLGVSAAVLNSAIGLAPVGSDVTFAFTPDVVLAPGEYFVVTRPLVPYPASFINFIAFFQKRIFLGIGGSHFHGPEFGIGFDQANYWGTVDTFFDVTGKALPTPIIWSPPAAVFGDTLQTPDLSALIQEVITTSGHEATSAVAFIFTTVGETRTFRFASNDHATLDPPSIHVQYKARYARPDGAL